MLGWTASFPTQVFSRAVNTFFDLEDDLNVGFLLPECTSFAVCLLKISYVCWKAAPNKKMWPFTLLILCCGAEISYFQLQLQLLPYFANKNGTVL